MSLSIKTNTASLFAYQALSKNSNRLNGSLEKLSSGLRINRAADDGSGMVIADSLKAQSRGLGQAVKNANDAISIAQTVDGALDESINIVNIIKTKAIQASQDGQTYESRKIIQEDINKLRQELDHLAKTTSFNGQKLLSGEFTNKSFHVGAYTGETVNISVDSSESTKIGHTTVAEVIPDYTKRIYTTLQDKATGEDIVIEPFQIEYYTPDLMKEELDKLTSEDISKLTNEELGKRTNLDISKLTNQEIEELRNRFIDEIVENASEELKKNISDRLVKSGIGTLAEQINKFEEKTDVKAFPIVESESRIIEGNTSEDFKINGITIGNFDVLPNDSDGRLVKAINNLSSDTGVTASVNAAGMLELVSIDGRAIKVEGLPRPEVINSSALTTHGYLKMVSRNFGQYDVTQIGTEQITIQPPPSTTVPTTPTEVYTNNDPNYYFNPDNSHVYQALSDCTSWEDAVAKAAASSFNGISGYLATVTSSTEDNFIKSLVPVDEQYYLGGSDSGDEGNWTWRTGPEAGIQITAGYTNFQNLDPDGSGDYLVGLVTLSTVAMLWRDFPAYMAPDGPNYIVEFGGMPGDPIIVDGPTPAVPAPNTVYTDNDPNYYFNPENSHLYQVFSDSTSWADAVVKAATNSFKGISGYLTTIESYRENQFVAALNPVGEYYYMGGSDEGNKGTWTWRTGPEAGTVFYMPGPDPLNPFLDPSVGVFHYFLPGEVNAGSGDYLINRDPSVASAPTSTPKWGDIASGTPPGEPYYIIEYGGMPDDPTIIDGVDPNPPSPVEPPASPTIEIITIQESIVFNKELLRLCDVNVTTFDDAQISMELADVSLRDLDKIRSNIGSVQNQLQSTISNITNTQVNIKASESSIRDLDFSSESQTLSKLQVFAQSGAFAMAQANSSKENLMSLLQ